MVDAVGHAHERLDPVLVRPKNAKRRVGFKPPHHDVVARGHAVGDDAEHPVAVVRRRVKRGDGVVTKTTHSRTNSVTFRGDLGSRTLTRPRPFPPLAQYVPVAGE